MIEAPSIVRTGEREAAVIRLTIPRAEIREVMEPAIREVLEVVSAQGMRPAGPLFSYHLRNDPGVFDFEVGVPVSKPVSPAGRVQPGRLPAATVARTVYRGPYEGLPGAWTEFEEWAAKAGHTTAAGFWESYVAGPESDADPAAWKTELNRILEAVAPGAGA